MSPRFATTRWSLVAHAAADDSRGRRALGELCDLYWRPLYAFLRRSGSSEQDAEDTVQGFLADLLARGDVARADRGRGRFRTFLLAALKNYASKQRDRDAALKRGGGVATFRLDPDAVAGAEAAYRHEPSDDRTPEEVFERQWALTLLDGVLTELAAKYESEGRGEWFAALRPTLTGGGAQPYAELAATLGSTPGAIKTAVSRLRREYRDRLDAALCDGALSDDEIADERRALLNALAR